MLDYCIQIRIQRNEVQSTKDEPILEFHAHLIIEESHEEKEIKLKIFHDPQMLLEHELEQLWQRTDFIGEMIHFVKANDNVRIDYIDFTNSKLTKFKISSSFFENGNKFLMIEMDKVRIAYKKQLITEEYPVTSEFFLDDTAFELIEKFYTFFGFVTREKPIWQPVSREDKFVDFGEVKIKLDYHFYSKESEDKKTFTIFKRPRLLIKHDNIEEEEVIHYFMILNSLISLYRGEQIGLLFARIQGSKGVTTRHNVLEKVIPKKSSIIYHLGFRGSVINLISQINPEKIKIAPRLYSEFVQRFLIGLKIDGEFKFMLYYNLLEQIRNEFISSADLKEEYTFTMGKDKVGKHIRQKLRSISEIITKEEAELFKTKVIGHVRTIKLLPMKDQFGNLFKMLEIEEFADSIDFDKALSLRNLIFHGNKLDDDEQDLEKITWQLQMLVGKILLAIVNVRTRNE